MMSLLRTCLAPYECCKELYWDIDFLCKKCKNCKYSAHKHVLLILYLLMGCFLTSQQQVYRHKALYLLTALLSLLFLPDTWWSIRSPCRTPAVTDLLAVRPPWHCWTSDGLQSTKFCPAPLLMRGEKVSNVKELVNINKPNNNDKSWKKKTEINI